jgi:hypothetical protein
MMNKWSLLTLNRKLQTMLGRDPFYGNARFFSIKEARNLLGKALNGIDYSIRWSTTLYPRILLLKESRFPFGAFLGLAAKFNPLTSATIARDANLSELWNIEL